MSKPSCVWRDGCRKPKACAIKGHCDAPPSMRRDANAETGSHKAAGVSQPASARLERLQPGVGLQASNQRSTLAGRAAGLAEQMRTGQQPFIGLGFMQEVAEALRIQSETTAGPDRRPLCENCGEQYHKHGKGNLACPGSEMGNVYRAQAVPAMPHASLALKEFMSELGEIMSMEDGAKPADYLQRAREIRQWCSDHQGSAVKTPDVGFDANGSPV